MLSNSLKLIRLSAKILAVHLFVVLAVWTSVPAQAQPRIPETLPIFQDGKLYLTVEPHKLTQEQQQLVDKTIAAIRGSDAWYDPLGWYWSDDSRREAFDPFYTDEGRKLVMQDERTMNFMRGFALGGFAGYGRKTSSTTRSFAVRFLYRAGTASAYSKMLHIASYYSKDPEARKACLPYRNDAAGNAVSIRKYRELHSRYRYFIAQPLQRILELVDLLKDEDKSKATSESKARQRRFVLSLLWQVVIDPYLPYTYRSEALDDYTRYVGRPFNDYEVEKLLEASVASHERPEYGTDPRTWLTRRQIYLKLVENAELAGTSTERVHWLAMLFVPNSSVKGSDDSSKFTYAFQLRILIERAHTIGVNTLVDLIGRFSALEPNRSSAQTSRIVTVALARLATLDDGAAEQQFLKIVNKWLAQACDPAQAGEELTARTKSRVCQAIHKGRGLSLESLINFYEEVENWDSDDIPENAFQLSASQPLRFATASRIAHFVDDDRALAFLMRGLPDETTLLDPPVIDRTLPRINALAEMARHKEETLSVQQYSMLARLGMRLMQQEFGDIDRGYADGRYGNPRARMAEDVFLFSRHGPAENWRAALLFLTKHRLELGNAVGVFIALVEQRFPEGNDSEQSQDTELDEAIADFLFFDSRHFRNYALRKLGETVDMQAIPIVLLGASQFDLQTTNGIGALAYGMGAVPRLFKKALKRDPQFDLGKVEQFRQRIHLAKDTVATITAAIKRDHYKIVQANNAKSVDQALKDIAKVDEQLAAIEEQLQR